MRVVRIVAMTVTVGNSYRVLVGGPFQPIPRELGRIVASKGNGSRWRRGASGTAYSSIWASSW